MLMQAGLLFTGGKVVIAHGRNAVLQALGTHAARGSNVVYSGRHLVFFVLLVLWTRDEDALSTEVPCTGFAPVRFTVAF